MELLINAGLTAERTLDRCLHRKWGLTYPQYRALKSLAKRGVLTMGTLAEDQGCNRGNLTGVTDRLERDGWVMRERSKDDRRVVEIRLLKPAEFHEVTTWVATQQTQLPEAVTTYLTGFLGQSMLAGD